MTAQLSQVLSAAIADDQKTGRYNASYERFLKKTPPVPFDPCAAGKWIPREEIDPASSLAAVLERGTLRIGYVNAEPYVFGDDLMGIDYETGNALTVLIGDYYKQKLAPQWVYVDTPYSGESQKFTALYAAMSAGDFDVALAGQANIGDEVAVVDWFCPTDLCFTNLVYSGLGGFKIGPFRNRDEVVSALKTLGDISVAYMANNPGPSSPSAINLMHDVPNIRLMPANESNTLNGWVADQICHFTVGDGIASSWNALTMWPKATNFNVQVATSANPPQQVCGFALSGSR